MNTLEGRNYHRHIVAEVRLVMTIKISLLLEIFLCWNCNLKTHAVFIMRQTSCLGVAQYLPHLMFGKLLRPRDMYHPSFQSLPRSDTRMV